MSEWISVKDRMPEYEQLCIVRNEHNDFVIALKSTENSFYDPYFDDDYFSSELIDVTHWMPIPEFKDE